jgi:hypothetical protein
MSQEKIQKKVEPFLHMVPIGLGLGVSVHFLVLDMYNQTDGMPWCTLIPLPNWCIPSVGNGCVRGVRKMISVVIVGTLVSVDFVVVTVSLFLVVRHMYGQHTILKQYIKQSLESTEEEETLDPELLRQIERGRHCLKAVSIHSIAYICCFIVTLFFLCLGEVTTALTKKEISNVCRKLNIFFLPLQGFFNFLIFAGNKLHVIY